MKLTLIRGLPGSGKSTLALRLARHFNAYCFEADLYFLDDEGEYIFDATKLHAAHKWCQDETKRELNNGNDVIVSNTFTTKKELKPYFEIAKDLGIVPVVYHCQNDFGSIHDVPKETIDKMKARWYNDISELFEELK